MYINLKQNHTGLVKNVKLGFSWTGLFFTIFVPLFRGDLKGFLLWVLFAAVSAYTDVITFGNYYGIITGPICFIIIPALYNKSYVKRLISDKGYLPETENDRQQLQSRGINVTKIAD